MSEKVAVLGIEREKDYIYFLDKDGDVSRARMMHGGRKKKVKKVKV